MLVVLDEYTREYLAIEVRRRLRRKDVVAVLEELTAISGAPVQLRADNVPEMISKAAKEWCAASGTDPLCIDPGYRGRTGSWRASTADCGTSCSRRRSSPHWMRQGCWWIDGGCTTTNGVSSRRLAS